MKELAEEVLGRLMAYHVEVQIGAGAIVGVGAPRRVSAVRWNGAQSIVVAWVVTMPAAGLVAAFL